MNNRTYLLTLTIWIGIQLNIFGQGDLLIFPKRVVLEGNKQREELNITNTGKDSAIYSISFVQYDMAEDGSFKQIDKNTTNPWFADPYLRIFPRKVALAPGESQTVRLQLRRKGDMATGEYRSHLYFRAEKDNKPQGTNLKKDKSQVSVQIIPIYGITIPTIIRIGQTQATATLTDLKLESVDDTTAMFRFTINRFGNCSIYGDISAIYKPSKGKTIEVSKVKGIGIYTCINRRFCALKIKTGKEIDLNNGKLIIRYTSPADTPLQVYAEKEL